jgi:hypothetical protein
MPPARSTAVEETREQRIQAILSPVRPIVEAKVRELVERAVDVSEAEEFGAIDLEFRTTPPWDWSMRSSRVCGRCRPVRGGAGPRAT